jgi:calnexin
MRKAAILLMVLLASAMLVAAAKGGHDHHHDHEHDHHDHDHDHDDHDHDGHDHDHGHDHSHSHAKDVSYTAPKFPGKAVFVETFDPTWTQRWTLVEDAKYNGPWRVEQPTGFNGLPGDKGLVATEKARHYAAAAAFSKPWNPAGKELVLQYEVRLQQGQECGGAYLKLVSADSNGKPFDAKKFKNDYPYVIMFGPDKCGSTNVVHFIFRHKNPVTGEWEEKHLQNGPIPVNDKLTHLYTLHIKPDNTFEVLIDQVSHSKGTLLDNFKPPVNPPAEIDDPTDKKPSDWVDVTEIPDPDAKKPDDWDETQPKTIADPEDTKPDDWDVNAPAQIPDPAAVKPADWSVEDDGEWVAPLVANPKCEDIGCGPWSPRQIANPKYKGVWVAPKISNPAYKGPWKARQIPNPHYFKDDHPANLSPIAGVGIDIWTMSGGIMFDNIILTEDKLAADAFAAETFVPKHKAEKQDDEYQHPQEGSTWQEKILELVEETRRQLQNPVVAVATALAVLIPIGICALVASSGKKKQPAARPASPAAAIETAPPAPATPPATEVASSPASGGAGSPAVTKVKKTPKAE